MSVVIYDMDMPESCGTCPFRHKGSRGIYYCMAAKGRYVDDQLHEYEDERSPDCPMKPLGEKDGH